MFPNAHSIRPYLEDPLYGPTSIFCSDLALSLRCYVTAGYPERLSPEEVGVRVSDAINSTAENDAEVDNEIIGANSAILYGPDGKWVGSYRKTNLFKTDLTWAKAGMLRITNPTFIITTSHFHRYGIHNLPPPRTSTYSNFSNLQRPKRPKFNIPHPSTQQPRILRSLVGIHTLTDRYTLVDARRRTIRARTILYRAKYKFIDFA
jgi:hypothetical protein